MASNTDRILLTTALLLGHVVSVDAFQVQNSPFAHADSTKLFGLLGRFRKQRAVEQPRLIAEGDQLPDVDVELLAKGESGEVEATPVSLREAIGDTRTVLVGMPGAFTPTCTKVHVPSYIENKDKLKQLGIDMIAIITTNDRFVNEEWSQQTGLFGNDSVVVLCDADGDVVKSMGLAEDMGFGVGIRSKRFAMVTKEGGTMDTLLTDEGLNDCTATSAENLIKILTPDSKMSETSDSSTMFGLAGAAVALLVGVNVISGGDGSSVGGIVSSPPAQVNSVRSISPRRSGAGEMSLLKMLDTARNE